MNVEFLTCNRNQLYDMSVRPIKNGQIIALADQDGAYYDMKGERRSVSGIKYFDSYDSLPNLGHIDMLYIVRSDADKSKIGAYTWNVSKKKFDILGNINTDENVKTTKDDTAKIFLTGAVTTSDAVGPLKVNSQIYVQNGKLKSVKGFDGRTTDSAHADQADSAESDNKGRVIDETYVEDVTISGRDVTVLKDGQATVTTIPDENTHYETSIVATGSSTSKKNAAAVNGKVHLVLMDDERIKSAIKIIGAGNTQVTSDANGVITITGQDNDTTYSNATQSDSGLMSPEDKKKLDGIAANANNYSLPQATTNILGGVKVGENITVDGGEINITKQNVIDALGYTPGDPAVSSTVTGVKGYKETDYRAGQVSLSYANVGALSEDTHYAKSDSVGGDAVKAKTADSSTKSSSVIDCTDSSKTIQIGHSKTDVTEDTLKQLAGYTYDSDGSNVKIVDVSKYTFKQWLGLGDMAYADSESFTIDQATSDVLGTVKIGYTANGKNYPVELNSSGQMYVNVPWVDTNTHVSVVNNLTSTSTTSALSAYQGKVLDGKITSAANSAGTAIDSANTAISTANDAKDTASGTVLFRGICNQSGQIDVSSDDYVELSDSILNYERIAFYGFPSYWPASESTPNFMNHNSVFLGELFPYAWNGERPKSNRYKISFVCAYNNMIHLGWAYVSSDSPTRVRFSWLGDGYAVKPGSEDTAIMKRIENGYALRTVITKIVGYK